MFRKDLDLLMEEDFNFKGTEFQQDYEYGSLGGVGKAIFRKHKIDFHHNSYRFDGGPGYEARYHVFSWINEYNELETFEVLEEYY